MRVVTRGAALLAAAVICLLPLAVAHAQLTPEPITGQFTDQSVRPELAPGKGGGTTPPNLLAVVYDKTTASAPNFGLSSSDLAAVWGDELFTLGTGLLSTHKFTLFSTGSSAGNLLTATVGVSFFDGPTSTFLGGYTTNINFGAGLPPGSYSIITVTGLDPLLILLNSTDLVVTQTVMSKTGPANRLGIASLNPITSGSSPISMYINASTVGPASFYNVGNPPVPANPGYQIAVNSPPVGTVPSTWGRLRKLYR